MPEPREVVSWTKTGYANTGEEYSFTKYHYITTSFSDTHGRTACGKRYPRGRSYFRPFGLTEADLPKLCKACDKAAKGAYPKMMEGPRG